MISIRKTLIMPLGIVLAAVCGSAQSRSTWRTWDVADGFEESYTGSVALTPDGRVWVKHGAVGQMNLLNGYASPQFPDPEGRGKITSAPDGTLWVWSANRLKRFSAGNWSTYSLDSRPAANLENIPLAPLDRNCILIILPDQIVEFDARGKGSRQILAAGTSSLSQFSDIAAAGRGSFYVTGQGGVGRLTGSAGGQWHWASLPPPPSAFTSFEEPFDWSGSGVLVTGVTPGHEASALGFDGKVWRELYKGVSRTVRAWPGGAGSLWIQDGDAIVELVAGKKLVAEKTGALAGTPLAIVPEAPGRFWVATYQGLAHHMPQLWQTPPEAPRLDDVVNAITEDRAGRVWFLSPHHLTSLDQSKWESFPLPKGETPRTILTGGLAVLENGMLVINPTSGHLLTFDPVRHSFQVVRHPANRGTRTFAVRPDGSLLVETFANGVLAGGSHPDAALEIFDGTKFQPFLEFSKPRDSAELRSLEVGRDGEIWAGGTTFFGVYHGANLRVFNAGDGFDDPGAYTTDQDRSGLVTAGGRDGLFQLRGGKWVRIRSGLDRVRSIFTSRDGTLWITSGTGVHRYRNGIWISNDLEEGLPSNVAYKIFEDSQGRIWAGTTRGLSLFHPEADSDPPVAMLPRSQNERETAPGGQTRLVFAGMDKWKFTPASRLLFSYRLDGGAWSVFAPATFAAFEKLPAGPHRFEVRAMDRNGNLSVVPAVHQFSVLCPWYATAGFRWMTAISAATIALLVALAMLSYSHRGRLILELNRKAKLERDRQVILQMIAGREPLPSVLQQIAVLAAGNCPGANCMVLHMSQTGPKFFSFPSTPAGLSSVIEQLYGGGTGSDEWWQGLSTIVRNCLTGDSAIASINSPARRIGAIVLSGCGQQDLANVQRWLESFSDLTAAAIENAGLYERLEHQAKTDTLTGLPNRLSFEQLLESSVDVAKTQGYRLAVLYLDLDRFKQVNDTLGHRVGDLLLKEIAVRLTATLKSLGTLARIGGDEFTILVDRPRDTSSIEALAGRLLASLRPPALLEGHTLFASASIGISYFPENGETPFILQKNADSAMYKAKAEGRNLVKSYSPEMDTNVAAAMGIEELLHRALGERLFELHYQPQYGAAGKLTGFEAMLRLRNHEGGYLNTGDFIPIAEETGLIVPIGAWALREACRQLREWLDEGLEDVKIAVNVSAAQISRPSFADEVTVIIAETGLRPHQLLLELTESAIMRHLEESKRQLERLRKVGVGIAIDAFGAGQSLISCLQDLPMDALKIDRSLVQRISTPGGLSMLKAIVALASNLQLNVIAVGVETEGELAALENCDCDALQGYLLCGPRPASEIHSMLDFRKPSVAADEESKRGLAALGATLDRKPASRLSLEEKAPAA